MKHKILLLLSLMHLLFFYQLRAQTHKESRSLGAFDAVKISNSIEAELVKGDNPGIEISASGIESGKIETKINKNTLTVGIGGTNFGASSVKVKITYRQIDDITAGSGSKVFVAETLNSKVINVAAHTGSYIEVTVN